MVLSVDVCMVKMFWFTEDEELRRTLQSLACGKARVLTKQPKVCAQVQSATRKLINIHDLH